MDSQNDKQNLITFFRNEPLVIFDEEITKLDISNNKARENNIFLGIGLTTSIEVSVGVPFDILGMLLVTEKIRRKLNFNKVIIQIADEHALTNTHVEEKPLNIAAKSLRILLNKICKNLNLNDFIIFLSSEIDKHIIKDELKEKMDIPELINNQYFFCELADMEFFRRVHNVTTKISWIIPGVESNGHDERFFDSHFSQISNLDLLLIKIIGGLHRTSIKLDKIEYFLSQMKM